MFGFITVYNMRMEETAAFLTSLSYCVSLKKKGKRTFLKTKIARIY